MYIWGNLEIMKQTAVEWLAEQFNNINVPNSQILFNQAKEMEKQQIEDAYTVGQGENTLLPNKQAEQYYNETYHETNN